MAAKVLAIFASAVLVETISAQCLGALNAFGPPAFMPDAFALGGPGYGPTCGAYTGMSGISPSNLGAAYGGGLQVTSSSPIAPTGLSVSSENAIEGALSVAGNLPFLGTVGVEGMYPTAGAGAVSYGCGDGAIGITAENIGSAPMAAAGVIAPAAMAPGLGYPPLGYKGIGPKAGCGVLY